MRDAGVISGVSVSHVDASVDEIESAGGPDARTTVRALLAREGVSEAFALVTCNRSEAYVVTEEAAAGRAALEGFAPDVHDAAVRGLDHEESIRHLMRVAAGLESLVLGEDQILGQFRSAIEAARAAGGVDEVLDGTLTKALHVGERARTETGVNDGATSLGSAAVELARREFDRALAGASALVVGAGEMAALAGLALADAGVASLVVANRTLSNAEHVVAEVADDAGAGADAGFEATAVTLDALESAVAEADVVVAATGSPEHVLDRATLADAGPTVVVDVAQPRDVDPGADDLPGVVVRDLDALEAVTEETRATRREEAAAVEAMIDEEFERLMESYKRARADEAIATMYEGAERVKRRELETALSKLDAQGGLTAEQRETVTAMADALVKQLLAAPTRSLREAAGQDDWTTIHTALHLFDPEFDAPPGERTRGDDPDRARPPDGRDDADADADAGGGREVDADVPDGLPDRVLDRVSNAND
jgi:glutamyl-tRNA reductase